MFKIVCTFAIVFTISISEGLLDYDRVRDSFYKVQQLRVNEDSIKSERRAKKQKGYNQYLIQTNRNTFGSGPIDGWAIKSRSNSAVILAAIAIDGVSIIADITDSKCIITYAITATGSRIIYGMGNASAGLIGQFFE